MSKDTGTALTPGQLAEFLAAVVKALILIAHQITPQVAFDWARNGQKLQDALLAVLTPLLKVLGTIDLPATTAPFVVAEKFVVNTAADAAVSIAYVSPKFQAWFGPKTEAPATASTLRSAQLVRFSSDGPILAELGNHAEINLAALWSLIERQPHGENGPFLNTGQANIFYVLNAEGARCAVEVFWYSDGWGVNADSVEGPDEWSDGYRVFSRNP